MYTLNIANNSNSDGTFVIFQVPQETNLHSLAWKTFDLNPQQCKTVKWEMDYSFVCGVCASIKPGALFKSNLIVVASLPERNEVTCTSIHGKCGFDDPRGNGEDMFTIIEMDDIPINKLGLGISVNDSPMFVAQAQPTSQLDLPEPQSKYYVSFGNFREGEVLDTKSLIRNAAVIDYSGVEQSMYVTFERDGIWSVSPILETVLD